MINYFFFVETFFPSSLESICSEPLIQVITEAEFILCFHLREAFVNLVSIPSRCFESRCWRPTLKIHLLSSILIPFGGSWKIWKKEILSDNWEIITLLLYFCFLVGFCSFVFRIFFAVGFCVLLLDFLQPEKNILPVQSIESLHLW